MTRAASISIFILLAISTLSAAFEIPADVIPKYQPKGRKSLGFGPRHSYSKFVTNDYNPINSIKELPKDELHSKALKLAEEIAGKKEGVAYFIRPDSYFDSTSGFTYIYIKQTVNGLQVENGDLNVVLSVDGQVLSYGTSLYRGNVPEPLSNPIAPAQKQKTNEECDALRSILSDHHTLLAKRSQVVFTVGEDEDEEAHPNLSDERVKEIQKDLFIFCGEVSDSPFLKGSDLGSHLTGTLEAESPIMDARLAILQFMSMATADSRIAATLSMPNREQIANSISTVFEHSIQPDGTSMTVEMLHDVPGTTAPVKARLGYIQIEDGQLNLVWHFEVAMDHQENSNFYQTTVDVTSAQVRSVVDWVQSAPVKHDHDTIDTRESAEESDAEAMYKVIKWGLNDPSEGNRTLERGVRGNAYSPYGWHLVPGKAKNTSYTDTRGNNVFASAFGSGMEDWQEPVRRRPKGKDTNGTLLFDFPFPWRAADKAHEILEPEKYADASTVNLFYLINYYHDMLYLYGFTPAAGNFEEAESKEGGKGGDAIAAYAISSAGTNNADFTTPPDGQRPRVRMYKWHTKENATSRDGDFEAGVVIHEVSHGLTTRLTGGPADSSCLGWGEAGGYGEGSGDFMATIIRRKSPSRDIYPMGSWVSHAKAGIRKYPYSTNLTLNPEKYSTLDSPGYWGVHAIGEVWSGMMYQVEEGLRSKYGWHPDLFPTDDKFYLSEEEVQKLTGGKGRASKRPIPRHGNTLAIALFVDSMKLQPCRPSFFDSRDAIIKADQLLTGGVNECLIWSRFAQRGLGVDASIKTTTPWGGFGRKDGFKIPSKCDNEKLY